MKKTLCAIAALCTVCGSVIAAPWSPDGARIAYSYIGGPESLFIVDARGGDAQDVVVRDQRDFRPEWAPDGSHLIFTSVVDEKHVIMRVDPDGANLKSLSEPDEALGGADYTSDGARIVMFTDEPRQRDLHLRDMATGVDTQLTDTERFDEMSPRWAPDDRRIVFVGREKDAESDIWILDVQTGEQQNLTQSPDIGEFHPDWSHDGKRVVYIRVKDGAFDVAVRDVETGVETMAASGDGFAVLSPHFSPDDSEIAFTRTDFAEKGPGMPAIVAVDLTTGEERMVARGKYLSQMASE